MGLLIYSLELEEWQSGSFLVLWASESRAYGRAEESSGTHEGAVAYHVIAGRMRKSYLHYKVNLHVRPSSCKILINDDDEKTDAKGTEVMRSASPSAIRRSARCCIVLFRDVSSTHL